MQIMQTDADKLKQLSNYLVHGVTPEQAGAAVGFSKQRVLELMEDDSFKEILKSKQEEIAARRVNINSLYDEIEYTALQHLAKIASLSFDPDMNMKLAMMANRAQKKVQIQENIPIDAQQANGKQVVINLSQTFIKQVQAGPLQRTVDVTVQKDELNIANPQDVKELLGIKSYRDVNSAGFTDRDEMRTIASFMD